MAPTLELTIAGVDKSEFLEPGMALERLLLEKSTLRFSLGNTDFEPGRYDPVYLTRHDAPNPDVVLFGGLITQHQLRALFGDRGLDFGVGVQCKDFRKYFDWTDIQRTYDVDTPVGTVFADIIADVNANDPSTGITVDPAQEAGTTLVAPFTLSGTAADAIRTIAKKTGWIDSLDPVTKYARLAAPGYLAAPTAVSEDDDDLGRFEVDDPDGDQPNAVTIVIGAAGMVATQTWTWHTGDPLVFVTDFESLQDGYAFNFPVAINGGSVPPNTGRFDTLSPPGLGGFFGWDEATHTLTQESGPGLVDGDEVTFSYRPPFPIAKRYPYAGSPPVISRREEHPEISTLAEAQQLADALHDSFGADARKASFTRKDFGWAPGQVVNCDVPSRHVSATDFSIDSVLMEWTKEADFVSSIEATEGNIYQGNGLTRWRELLGNSGGSGGSSSEILPTRVEPFTLSSHHLGGSSDPDDSVMVATWTDPAAPGATTGPYADDPLSADAKRVPNAVVFQRDNVHGAPFPIAGVLPFSVELESDQTGWIKIGIVDLDSDYGRPNYIFSYTVQMTAGVRELVRGGTWRAQVDSLQLQENHKYVLMFEGAHPLADTGIDGATIRIWDAFTLIWLALTSVQVVDDEPTLPAGSLLLPELRETSPNAMVAIDWAGTQLMPSPTIAFNAYYIGAMRALDGGGYMIQHSPGFPNYVMKFLDVNLAVVGTYSGLTATAKIGLSSNFVDAFYALDRTTMILRKFDPTGSVLQSWTLSATGLSSGELALAVSPDGTTAYYSDNGFQKIKKADLTGGSTPADATFADESASDAGSGGLGVGADALVILRDGKVLAYWRGYEPAGVYTNEKNIIRIYNPDGTTYATYTIGFNSAYYGGGYYVVGIAANGSDSSSFLAVEADDDNNQGRVREYRVSDGAVLNTRLLADGALDPSDYLNGTGVLQMPIGATPVAATW